jgi:hypothetical protein
MRHLPDLLLARIRRQQLASEIIINKNNKNRKEFKKKPETGTEVKSK